MEENYVIGIDFGTDSVRAVIFNIANGEAAGEGVAPYQRWSQGEYCDPALNQFRQHPLDYLEGLESAVREALADAGEGAHDDEDVGFIGRAGRASEQHRPGQQSHAQKRCSDSLRR